jgi:glycosyltransferase involved in cell wall biosynthesis
MVDQRAKVVRLTPPATFGLPSELNYFRFSRMVERELAASLPMKSYDFIYQRLSVANYSGMKLSRTFGVPLVIEYNGSEVWVAQNWGSGMRFASLALRAEEQTLKAAHVVVTVSDVLRDELVARGIPSSRIVSYPNCINPDLFDRPLSERIGGGEGQARDPSRCGLATFVGTFAMAWRRSPGTSDSALAVSKPDWLRQNKLHFCSSAMAFGVPKASESWPRKSHWARHFAGLIPQAEAPRYLAASDVFLSPHVPNSDGTVLGRRPSCSIWRWEADHRVGPRSGRRGVEERCAPPACQPVNRDERFEMAVLTVPGSEEDIISALVFLAENPDRRQRLGANARKEALAKYTWKHHVEAILTRLRNCSRPTKVARAS